MKKEFKVIAELLPNNSRVLDVGCGDGSLMNFLVKEKNIETRGLPTTYQQVGILNRTNDANDMILPLMGKRTMAGRDKWQYYTVSGSGNLNTRLPISVNGKNCTGEYGCDEIYNGDVVYVEGYNDTFLATIYENGTFQYIPLL